DIIGRLANYYNRSSLQCYAHVALRGSITEKLSSYCLSHGYERGVVLTQEPNGETTAYDWQCESSSHMRIGVSMTDACQWAYNQKNVFDRLDNFHAPNSWQCWVLE